MAYEGPMMKATGLKAGADLSSKQHYFVKMTADNTVGVCAAVTDIPIGVLLNAPTSGESAEVCIAGVCKVSGDEDLDVADLIGTSSDGQAQVVAVGSETTVYIVGQVIAGNGAAGGLATCAVNCLSPARAA